MKLTIPISVGDFLDRYTILKIKSNYKLPVQKELEHYVEKLKELPSTANIYIDILHSINLQLWHIEDKKRRGGRYTEHYSDLSTLTCQLNDLRHFVKKQIDELYNSDITEQKSHASINHRKP